MQGPTSRHRASAVGAAFVALIVLTGTACSSTTAVAAGTLAPQPTATPLPTPEPTPTALPTPVPLPTPRPTDRVRPADASRGVRQFVALPTAPHPTLVPVRSASASEARPWPTDLAPIVDFVETVTDVAFRTEAPRISHVSQDAMVTRLTDPLPSLNDLAPDVAEAVRRVDDAHRALGIAVSSFDVLVANAETARSIHGVFTETTHEILIRSDPDTPLQAQSVDLQATIVHEIAHAWQGRDRISRLRDRATDQLVAGALIEGEAEWISQFWLSQQSDQVRQDYHTALEQTALEDPSSTSTVQPASLVAETQMQYQLGRRLYAVARDRHVELGDVDSLPMIDGGSLLDPLMWIEARSPQHELLPPLAAPFGFVALPDVRPPANPGLWLQVLATAAPFPVALDAARSITSTAPLTAWIGVDGTTCVRSRLTATVEGGTAVTAAFEQWVDRLPTHRTVHRTSQDLTVEACDSGPEDVPVPLVAPDQAIVAVSAVIDVEAARQGLTSGPLPPACVAAIAAAVSLVVSDAATIPVDWTDIAEISAIERCH